MYVYVVVTQTEIGDPQVYGVYESSDEALDAAKEVRRILEKVLGDDAEEIFVGRQKAEIHYLKG